MDGSNGDKVVLEGSREAAKISPEMNNFRQKLYSVVGIFDIINT